MWLIRIGSRTPASALCRKQQQSCPMVWPMALRPCFAGDSTWKQLRSLWLQLWSKIVGKTTQSGCQTLSKCFQFKHVWLVIQIAKQIEIGLVYLIFHNFDTKQSTSICNTPSSASVTPFHPSMNINDDYLGTLFTKQTLQTLKQLQLCTSTSHSEMKLTIDRADRRQAMLRCQRPIDIVVKKESPPLHRSSFGNLPSKKTVKKIFHISFSSI